MAQVRTRKRGKTYSYIFEAGQVNGKRKVIEKGGFATKDEAYEAGVTAFTSWKHGNIGVTSEKITLLDFSELWQKNVAQNIKDSTKDTYTSLLNSKIRPLIGNVIIQDIKPATIESWITKLYAAGYSKSYIKECRMVLKAMLDYAVHPCGLISSNPCVYVKVPKKAPTNVTKRTLISSEHYHALMEKYPVGHNMHLPIAIFYHTGMRIGEVLGLTWEDIDFDAQTILITKQRKYASTGPTHNIIDETKTEKSKRKIFISKEFVEELKAEKARQAQYTVINAVDANGYVYTYSAGIHIDNLTPVHLVCITSKCRPVNRAQLTTCLRQEGINSHSFRHTQATRLAKAKVPPVTAARRLGHATVGMTLNLYTHDTEDMQRNAMESLYHADKQAHADKMQT